MTMKMMLKIKSRSHRSIKVDLGQDMDINMLNIKCVYMYRDGYMY